jgi:hypothetical protein
MEAESGEKERLWIPVMVQRNLEEEIDCRFRRVCSAENVNRELEFLFREREGPADESFRCDVREKHEELEELDLSIGTQSHWLVCV